MEPTLFETLGVGKRQCFSYVTLAKLKLQEMRRACASTYKEQVDTEQMATSLWQRSLIIWRDVANDVIHAYLL
jgi:hypothetical protein